MASILFHDEKTTRWFRNRKLMKALLLDLFSYEEVPVETIQFILTSDEHVLSVNQEFLHHDFFTDIITFDHSSATTVGKVADIFISVDRVVANARTFQTAREEELRRVMIHGCLHLCGYKDKLKANKAEMRTREDFYLRRYRKRST